MMKNDQAVWLVKSSGRVLGPHTRAEIVDLLRSKEIVPIDEVCEPMRRWHMLRDHGAFARVVDELRIQHGGGRDDTTQNVTMGTASVTDSFPGFQDEITEDVGDYQKQLKEIVYDRVQEVPSSGPKNVQARYQAAGQINELRIRQEAARSSRWLWAITIFVLVAVAGVLVWRQKSLNSGGRANLTSSELLQLGMNQYQDGDYPLALENFKRLVTLDGGRRAMYVPFGLLLLHIEGQTVEARSWLNRADETSSTGDGAPRTALGNVDLHDGEWNRAAANFKMALERDAKYLPALANLGSVALLNKEFQKAITHFESAMAQGLEDGGVLIQYVEAIVGQFRLQQNKSLLREANNKISAWLKNHADYAQELKLGGLYLDLLRGDSNRLDSAVREILDMDPIQTDDHRHDLNLFRAKPDWGQLNIWCNELVESGKGSAIATALKGYCTHRVGQNMAAKQHLEKAVGQAPRDPLLQALYGYAQKAAGLAGEASIAIGRAIELDRKGEFSLPVLLQARFCVDREDYECAQASWMKLMERQSRSLAARAGLIQIYRLKQGDTLAQARLKEMGEISPNYIPYLRLRRK